MRKRKRKRSETEAGREREGVYLLGIEALDLGEILVSSPLLDTLQRVR